MPPDAAPAARQSEPKPEANVPPQEPDGTERERAAEGVAGERAGERAVEGERAGGSGLDDVAGERAAEGIAGERDAEEAEPAAERAGERARGSGPDGVAGERDAEEAEPAAERVAGQRTGELAMRGAAAGRAGEAESTAATEQDTAEHSDTGPGQAEQDTAQHSETGRGRAEQREAESSRARDEAEPRKTPLGARWRALARSGTRSRAGLLIGLLIGLLGFALAVQVRSNTSTSGLPAARQEDLVRILDELSSREDRLRRQIAELEATRTRLSTAGDRSTAALEEARKRSTALGILAGTLPAQGPGVEMTLTDPERRLAAEDLLDAVEELRAAGAEAIEVGGVRIGLDSSFTATDRGIAVDGVPVSAPYAILAIGDPTTLATAMEIPGGVTDTVSRAGGEARIGQRKRVVIRALRPLKEPQYSRPSDGGR